MLSVKDLIEGRKNDTSSSLQLCGRLSTITSATDHHQRGSILLADILTGDAIPCQVDRMYHDLQGTLITISRWTFIVLGNGLQYLQFTMDYVKRFGSCNTLWDEKILAVRTFLQLLKDSTSSDFTCVQPRQLATTYTGDVLHGVSLAGVLCAKSILYIKQGSEACFFAELKDICQLHSSSSTSSFTAKAYEWTVPVVFKGDQFIKYYMELQVGRHYLFNNLRSTTMTTTTPQQQRRVKRSVLTFQAITSSFLELPKQQCEYLLSTYNPIDSDDTSFDVDMPHPAAVAAAALATASENASEIPAMPLSVLYNCQNNLHHYTGVVTRVIDPLFGVYELDKQILLCLFHYIGYSENCPYRIGTKLKITHAHVLSLDSLSTVSSLLDLDWNAPKMTRLFNDPDNDGYSGDEDNNARRKTSRQQSKRYILVACMRSDVRIEQLLEPPDKFGKEANLGYNLDVDAEERHIKDLVYAHCVGRHLTFAAMVRQLEIFESIKKKFSKMLGGGDLSNTSRGTVSPLIWLGKQLIETVFSTTGNRSVHGQGDLYGDFFQHGASCLAVNESTSATGTVTLDACPTLQHLISTILNNSDENATKDDGLSYKLDHVPLIEIPPSFVTSHADVTRYCYDAKTKDTAWVVGLVEALPDGQVYFIDDTYRIKLLVATTDDLQKTPSSRWKNTGRLRLGHVYIIKRFHLVIESLTLSGVASTLEQQYMMCDYQDMKMLGSFASSILSPTTAVRNTTLLVPLPTKKEDLLRLSHFSLAHGDGNTSLSIDIYVVLEMMPTMMKKDDNGVIGLEKWVRTLRYGFGTTADPAIVNLVFESSTGSLLYTGHLEVGTWFGLTLMEDDADRRTTSPESDHASRSKKKQHSQTIPVFLVDHSKHQFYPMIYQQHHSRIQDTQLQQEDMVFIHPVFGAKSRGSSPTNNEIWESLAPALDVVDAIKAKSPLKRQHDQMEDHDNNININNKKSNMVTLHGTVIFKGFIADEIINSYFVDDEQSTRQVELFQRLGVGVGQRGLKVFLRLQQANGLETVDIYLGGDIHHLVYFLGVIPGNKVTLFRLDKKRSYNSQKVYFVAGPYTYIETYPQLRTTLFDDLLHLNNRTCVRQLALGDMLPTCGGGNDDMAADGGDDDIDNDIFKAAVSIQRVEKIKLQWVCTLCGTEWYQNRCYGNCGEEGRQVFRAEAKVQVTDGTSIVLAMIDGEALVFRLLMLLPSQEEALKQAALVHGTLECGFWLDGRDDLDNMATMSDAALRNGMTLSDLGVRVKRHGQFYIYGKRHYQRAATMKGDEALVGTIQKPKMNGLGLQQRVSDDQDSTFPVLVYPLIKVKVEALELLEPEQQAWALIENLSSS